MVNLIRTYKGKFIRKTSFPIINFGAMTMESNRIKEIITNNYAAKIGAAIRNGDTLTIDFSDLERISLELANELAESPELIIKLIENAIEEEFSCKVLIKITNLPKVFQKSISDIFSKDFDHLASIKGMVAGKSGIYRKAIRIKYECPSCGNVLIVQQPFGQINEPKKCGCGRKGKFERFDITFEDYINVTISEIDEEGDMHELEVKVNLSRFPDFRTLFKPNNLVEVTGIITSEQEMIARQTINKFSPILLASDVKIIEQKKEQSDFADVEQLLDAMSPFQFEEFVARLFNKKEYNAKATVKTGDKGIDVIAKKDDEIVAIQCKKNRRDIKVSNSVVQKALGSLVNPYKANKCIVVTTSDEFTKDAVEQASGSQVNCELWNRKRLIAEIMAYMKGSEEGWNLLNEMEQETDLRPDIIDIDKLTMGINGCQRSNIHLMKEIISELENKIGRVIPIDDVLKTCQERGMSIEDISKTIEKLRRSGDLFEPKRGFLSKI